MISVPIVTQTDDFSCAECCLKSILQHYGVKKNYKISSPIDGANPRSLEFVLRKENFNVVSGNLGIKLIRYITGKKIPVIVCYDGHYSIVTGFQNTKIIMMDPLFDQYQYLNLKKFRLIWEDFDTDGTIYRSWGIYGNPSIE